MYRKFVLLFYIAIICVACSLRAPRDFGPRPITGRAPTPSQTMPGSTRTQSDSSMTTDKPYPLPTLSTTEKVTPGFAGTDTVQPPCTSALNTDKISIKKSEKSGWCELEVPLRNYRTFGYRLMYPEEWSVRLAGAEGMNLLFNEGIRSGKNQQVFLQLTLTNLPLENADQATYSFEGYGPEPLVDSDELVQEKSIETIGDKQVLKLITSKEDEGLVRYFLRYKSTLYMFEIVTPVSDFNNDDHKQLLQLVEEMIVSMHILE